MINIKCKKCGWMLPFQAKSNKDNVCGRKSIDIVCLKCGKILIRKGGNVNRWYWLCSDTFRLFCCNLFKPILIFVIVFLVEEKTDIIIMPSRFICTVMRIYWISTSYLAGFVSRVPFSSHGVSTRCLLKP